MEKLIILILILISTIGLSQSHGLLSAGHYVPDKFKEVLIKESECYEENTTTVVSIPFENKNYIYKITNYHGYSRFEELEKTRLHLNSKKIIGIPIYFIAWGAMLVFL